MSTRVFNLNLNSPPVPGPTFLWSRDTEGKCTGRHTFTALKGSMQQPGNQARFKKGTPVTSLDPSILSTMAFMTLDSFEAQTIPGGFEEITADFSGFSEGGDFEFDREVSYSSNNSLVEKSILQNPRYLKAVTAADTRDCFAKLYNGMATAKPTPKDNPTSIAFYDLLGNHLMAITDAESLKWYRLIFVRDFRTYMAPTFEWVKSTTNAGGLTDTELEKLGLIDEPPGDAPEPPAEEDFAWVKTGASDVRGEGSASTEETWTWAMFPADIYEEA